MGILSTLGSIGGTAVGGPGVGTAIGGFVGKLAEKLLGGIFGGSKTKETASTEGSSQKEQVALAVKQAIAKELQGLLNGSATRSTASQTSGFLG